MGLFETIGKIGGGIVGFFTGGPAGAVAGMETGGKAGNAISDITGQGGDQQPAEPIPVPGASNINYPGSSDLFGFNVKNYLPQYANGGVPNKGNPAMIVDLKTGMPAGTMNEQGPETIVPTMANIKTPNATVMPATLMGENTALKDLSSYQRSLTGNQSNVQSLGTGDTTANLPDVKRIEPTGSSLFGETTKVSGMPGESPTGGKLWGDNNFGDILKSVARATGYYYDAKREALGLGKSALTRYLDWTDEMYKTNIEGKKKTTINPDYGTVDIVNEKTGKIETWSFDKNTGEKIKNLGEKPVKSPSEGKISGQLTENQIMNRMQGKEKDIYGDKVPGWNELDDEQVKLQYDAMQGTAEKFPTTKSAMDKYMKQRNERSTNTELIKQEAAKWKKEHPGGTKEDWLKYYETWRKGF